MSRKGNCWDVNAAMESFFSRLKVELIYAEQYQSLAETKSGIFEYIELREDTVPLGIPILLNLKPGLPKQCEAVSTVCGEDQRLNNIMRIRNENAKDYKVVYLLIVSAFD